MYPVHDTGPNRQTPALECALKACLRTAPRIAILSKIDIHLTPPVFNAECGIASCDRSVRISKNDKYYGVFDSGTDLVDFGVKNSDIVVMVGEVVFETLDLIRGICGDP